jgi:hypothetical protein
MDNVEKRLLALKDEIYDTHIENDNNDDFTRLVQLKDVTDEVFETLILLHSNYKSSMQTMKFSQIVTLNKLIDANIEMLSSLKKNVNSEAAPVVVKPSKGFFSDFPDSGKIIISIGILIVILVGIHYINPTLTKEILDMIRSIFTGN